MRRKAMTTLAIIAAILVVAIIAAGLKAAYRAGKTGELSGLVKQMIISTQYTGESVSNSLDYPFWGHDDGFKNDNHMSGLMA